MAESITKHTNIDLKINGQSVPGLKRGEIFAPIIGHVGIGKSDFGKSALIDMLGKKNHPVMYLGHEMGPPRHIRPHYIDHISLMEHRDKILIPTIGEAKIKELGDMWRQMASSPWTPVLPNEILDYKITLKFEVEPGLDDLKEVNEIAYHKELKKRGYKNEQEYLTKKESFEKA